MRNSESEKIVEGDARTYDVTILYEGRDIVRLKDMRIVAFSLKLDLEDYNMMILERNQILFRGTIPYMLLGENLVSFWPVTHTFFSKGWRRNVEWLKYSTTNVERSICILSVWHIVLTRTASDWTS